MTKAEILKELFQIQHWFNANDWKVHKFILGEWTEDNPKWIEYLTVRNEKRARQDYLHNLLQNSKDIK